MIRINICAQLILSSIAATIMSCGMVLPEAMINEREVEKQKERTQENQAQYQTMAKTLNPCMRDVAVKSHKRGFAVTILSLKERKWILDFMNYEMTNIVGRKCYKNTSLQCISLSFYVLPDGTIEATPIKITGKSGEHYEQWMIELEQTHSEIRCYVDSILEEEMAKYGYEFH